MDNNMNPKSALRKAIKIAGNQCKLAEAIGCDRAAVTYWLNKNLTNNNPDLMSAKFAKRIEKFTNGEVLTEWLLPSLK